MPASPDLLHFAIMMPLIVEGGLKESGPYSPAYLDGCPA